MSRLPDSLDPWRAAEQGRLLEGSVPLVDLPRVAGLLATPEGDARFRLEFFLDHRGRACVRGQVQAEVPLVCQRCLDPVTVPVDASVLLAVVSGVNEAARLPDAYEPLLAEDDRIAPLDLIEDEIILALPHVPRHEPRQACRNVSETEEDAGSATGEVLRDDNPFRVLADWKKPLH
jgi:uncharacterized protein